jgi:hypothetical protein
MAVSAGETGPLLLLPPPPQPIEPKKTIPENTSVALRVDLEVVIERLGLSVLLPPIAELLMACDQPVR